MNYHTYSVLIATNGNAKDGAPICWTQEVVAVNSQAAEADVLEGFGDVRIVQIREVH